MQQASGEEVTIRPAVWPDDEATAVHLLRNYANFLGSRPNGAASICLGNYEAELDSLAARLAPPTGVLLLAFLGSDAAGCVTAIMHPHLGGCEMKRLWVEPHAQRRGVGRSLAEAAIHWARDHGAAKLLLDTVPAAMPQAAALYVSLGFRRTERYNESEVPNLAFYQLSLR